MTCGFKTRHDALLIGHEAGKKGRGGEKRREKRGKKKEKKNMREREMLK